MRQLGVRVLLVHQPVDGGVGRHVSDLAAGLCRLGYEVTTCGPSPPEPINGVSDHLELDMSRSVSPAADGAAIAALSKITRHHKPDIVHAHSSKAGAVARLSRLLAPLPPVLYTPHGYAFAGYFEHASERHVYRQAERALSLLAARVICVCEAEAARARSIGPHGRVRVVHNGIDAAHVPLADASLATLGAAGPIVLTLSQLRPGKGMETLIDAAPLVLASHPGTQIVICGKGPLEPSLRARAALLGVGQAIHFIGQTDSALSVMRAADLFVLPSWAEAFPYVTLEAMSCAVPVLACAVGGISEAIDSGRDGLIVAPRDAVALAQGISQLLTDGHLRQSLGTAGRERVLREFTVERMVTGISEIYGEVLGARRRVRPV
ncbi:MAG: glycosyltransferase [Solirubrobacteraceae bacterium]